MIVNVGGQKYNTSVCNEGGKHPTWNNVFNANINNDDVIRFEIWDVTKINNISITKYDSLSKNDLIGEGAMSIQTIKSNGGRYMGNVPLNYKGKGVGVLTVDISVIGGTGSN